MKSLLGRDSTRQCLAIILQHDNTPYPNISACWINRLEILLPTAKLESEGLLMDYRPCLHSYVITGFQGLHAFKVIQQLEFFNAFVYIVGPYKVDKNIHF